MNLVQNNPYRILGVPINAKEKEIQKQITKAKRFAEVGKEVKFDTDFLFLGKLTRDAEIISKSSSQIEQPNNKLFHSLFWFWKENHIDDAAMDNLKSGNVEKAIEIWTKVAKDGDVSERNYSNLANLKTLLLGLSLQDNSFNKEYFLRGINLSGKFLLNPSFINYCSSIAGEFVKISIDEFQEKFIFSIYREVKPFIDKTNGISTSDFLGAFKTFSEGAQQSISQKFTSDPLKRIEEQIENTSDLRNKNEIEAISFGDALYRRTKNDLAFLAKVLGKGDLKYQMLANKLANEILQCSIDFFNKVRDVGEASEQDGKNALRICKYAKSIVCGGQAKTRVDESMEFIEEWVNEAPERLKYDKVVEDIEYISKLISRSVNKIQQASASTKVNFRTDAENLISNSKTRLNKIKSVLGQNDEIYIRSSSEVAQIGMAFIVQYVNATASYLGVDSKTVSVLRSIGTLDMDSEARSKFRENKSTLEDMYNRSNAPRNTSSGGGCYIATMVYGDYDHPQVMVLREFRDNVLNEYSLGRSFIKFYYKHSPGWVEKLKNKKRINSSIKSVLNQLIKILKKS